MQPELTLILHCVISWRDLIKSYPVIPYYISLPADAYPLTTAFTDCRNRIHLVKEDREWIYNSLSDLGIVDDNVRVRPPPPPPPPSASPIANTMPFICSNYSVDNTTLIIAAGNTATCF